jgi:hypothetical protein
VFLWILCLPLGPHDRLHLEHMVGQGGHDERRYDGAEAGAGRLLLLVQARHQRVHLLLGQESRRAQQLVLAHRQVPDNGEKNNVYSLKLH